jgi:hypothetical protein
LQFVYSFTRWGDGFYEDQDGVSYAVDAGMLACLPLGMIDSGILVMLSQPARPEPCRGRVVTFSGPFVCVPCDAHGVIRFGHIVIETGDDDEADEGDED